MDVGETVELTEYQRAAQETAIFPEDMGIVYTALGLTGEAGEVANQVKKIIRDDGGTVSYERRFKLRDEMGDVLWYLSALATQLGLSLEDIAWGNIEKLRKRQQKGTLQGSGDR